MTKGKVTIYDIARIIGTSTATVSRVLSGSDYPVSAELRQKVLQTAQDMHYIPNLIGRQLKTHFSRDIGVIVPSIANPFYPSLVQGVEDVARERNYSVFLCNSYRSAQIEEQYIETLFQKRIQGLVLSSVSSNHDQLLDVLEQGVEVAAFDQDIPLDCHKIGFNYEKAGRMSAEYLTKLGHKRIAFLSSPLNRFSRRKMFEGFKASLDDFGIPLLDKYTIISEHEKETKEDIYEFQNGKNLAVRLINCSPLPTAVAVVNDMTALGVMQALQEYGIKIPDDISIIGFDNILISSMVMPPLTTINQPAYETGKLAAMALIDSIEGKRDDLVNVILEPSLVVRQSTRSIY